jgi:hypothetical protein
MSYKHLLVIRPSISQKFFFYVWLCTSKKSQNEDAAGYAIEVLHLLSCMQDTAKRIKEL